jgi:hypothetical protein
MRHCAYCMFSKIHFKIVLRLVKIKRGPKIRRNMMFQIEALSYVIPEHVVMNV